MIKCKDKSIYTGITNNLEKRVKQHNLGRGCKFTKCRIPVKLVYSEDLPSKGLALSREAEIKGWDKGRKLRLISQ